jgi:RNA polymerase sigma-70 factor (ECF subfamily)
MTESTTTLLVRQYLDELRAGDAAARERLLGVADQRLQALARQMVRDYPRLLRWVEADDVLQSAALRLWRALGQVPPPTPRDFLGLAALQIRRELLDLVRRLFGAEGWAAHHATPVPPAGGTTAPELEPVAPEEDPARLQLWTEFHEQVDKLPLELREVFDLLWYHDLTQEAAAAEQGLTPRQVKDRWQKARRLLHDLCGGRLPF